MQFFSEHARVTNKEIIKHATSLKPYLDELRALQDTKNYTRPESALNLAIDESLQKNMRQVAEEKATSSLKYIIVVGIGGAHLGTEALYNTFFGYVDEFEPRRFPKMLFIDTVDPEKLMMLRAFLGDSIKSSEEILVNIVSKSGTTLETIANAEFLIHALREHFSNIEERVVVTTTENSPLWRIAETRNITRLSIPQHVGGRYSVFSAVGLFPCYVMGMNMRNLLRGANAMHEICLTDDLEKNPALRGAAILYAHYKPGITHDNFFFHPELESLGKWYAQLLSESLGKEKNTKGEIVHAGIFPRISIGTTDLHALGQLNIAGPKNVITTFITSEKHNNDVLIPSHTFFDGIIPHVEKLSFATIMHAILEATEKTYVSHEMPFMEVKLTDISLGSIGEYMQWNMTMVMLLGKLIDVNPFDQPDVELYKTETRNMLGLL